MSGRRACSPFAGARFGLLALFVFRVALSLVARSLLSRHRPCCRCSSCGSSPLLAWRWRCHPGGCPHPSSVLVLVPSCVAWFAARVLPRACPSFVIRRSSDVASVPYPALLASLPPCPITPDEKKRAGDEEHGKTRGKRDGTHGGTEQAMSRAKRCLYSAIVSSRLVSHPASLLVIRLVIPHVPCLLISSRHHHLVSSRFSSSLLFSSCLIGSSVHQERHRSGI